MEKTRQISIIFGAMIIVSIISGILSSVPALEKPDFLITISSIQAQVFVAVSFQCLMAIAYTIIATILYPVIKNYNKTLAIGYFGFRIIGSVFLYFGIATLLSLLFLSKSFVLAGQPDPSYYNTIAELLRRIRDWLNHAGLILPWSIGGVLLYYSFFKMNSIPKWLSVWGIVGSILTLGITMLFILDFVKIASVIYFAVNMPTALFEITLAIFLIFKGFKFDEGHEI